MFLTAACIPLILTVDDTVRGPFYRRTLTVDAIAGHAGLPQITLPLPERFTRGVGGLAVGLSIPGAAGEDEALLAFASSLNDSFK